MNTVEAGVTTCCPYVDLRTMNRDHGISTGEQDVRMILEPAESAGRFARPVGM
jgi:hypothetical protein